MDVHEIPEDELNAIVDITDTEGERFDEDDHPDSAEDTALLSEVQEIEAPLAHGEKEVAPNDPLSDDDLAQLIADDNDMAPSTEGTSAASAPSTASAPMMALSTAQIKTILNNLGWRTNSSARYRQAIKDFQRAYNLGPALAVDGAAGPATQKALLKSDYNRRHGLGTASAHFSFIAFRCKCNGRYASCRRIWVSRKLLKALETYRSRLGHGITVVSGCRCTGHNASVGGVRSSQHLLGNACDVQYFRGWTSTRVAGLHIFTGIGRSRSTYLVRHVDVRSSASTSHPQVWNYAS